MEQEASGADEQIPEEGDLEDRVMSMLPAVQDSFHTKIQEQEIGEGIDDLCGINGGIIVLFGGAASASALSMSSRQHNR